ncbi:MAG TPA: prolyl oligopeptidase family serine peptidase [Xanthomonadaceae bacterium]|nr:prolyl oligopeptidase family serine peptidase [Xanthomonadaceae bacterium]
MKIIVQGLAAAALMATAMAGAGPAHAAEPNATAARPTIADFVRHATYSSVRISPTGEYLAMTVEKDEQDVLVVLRTEDLELLKINQLPDEKSVGSFHWTSPERLIFTAIRKIGHYAQPFGTGEWYGVNADGSMPRPLVFYGTRDVTQRGKTVGNRRFSLLDTLEEDDENVLMQVSKRSSREGTKTEVVLFDTTAGRWRTLAEAPRENCQIALGADSEPRFAICYDDEDEAGNYASETELYKRGDDGNWTLLNKSTDTGAKLSAGGTAGDGTVYATRAVDKGTTQFGTFDPVTGEFELLFHDPVSDPSGYIHASDMDTVIGVATEAGAPRVTMTNESHPDAALYQSLAASFPGQMVDFSSATADGSKIVVSVYSDRNPGQLYLYDRATKKARFLMQQRQWLDPETMASVKPFSFKSRDGLTLHGYLTIPHGSDGKHLPMIVNPHGGPMGPRDNWGFNTEAQLMASRGYAVMQVNFRGSGGFGEKFEDMAWGNWADELMYDIIDATKHMIAEGHADPERICIYGGSFGGYAAMMAPARAPGLYKCAFGYVGAYDVGIQFEESDTGQSEAGRRYLEKALGDTPAEWAAVSPVTYADQIDIPVYLAAGARDPRCPPENTEAMYAALKAAGNEPEGMIIQSGEMHGFYKEENNEHLYTEMLAFFDRHIGG